MGIPRDDIVFISMLSVCAGFIIAELNLVGIGFSGFCSMSCERTLFIQSSITIPGTAVSGDGSAGVISYLMLCDI